MPKRLGLDWGNRKAGFLGLFWLLFPFCRKKKKHGSLVLQKMHEEVKEEEGERVQKKSTKSP